MPIIPPYVPSGTNLDPSDLYDSSLYDPTSATQTPHTMEVLNGGLNKDNYTFSATNKLQAWQIQEGAFFRGYYSGFDRPDFISAQQSSGGDGREGQPENWIDHPALCQKFFLPWDASVVMYGYQGFFRQDCSVWESNETGSYELIPEAWYIQTTVDEASASLLTKLPYNRITKATHATNEFTDGSSDEDTFWDETAGFRQPIDGATNDVGQNGVPGVRLPNSIGYPGRWRWVAKQGMLKGLSKGYHDFKVRVWVDTLATRPDFDVGGGKNNRYTRRDTGDGTAYTTADGNSNFWIVPIPEVKLSTMSGAVWVVAMR